MTIVDEDARANGFADAAEMHRLTCRVRLRSPQDIWDFKRWQEGDGTRAGLLDLLKRQAPPKRDFVPMRPRPPRCPEHGLVLRLRHNLETGASFLACVHFPTCRFTESLSDDINDVALQGSSSAYSI